MNVEELNSMKSEVSIKQNEYGRIEFDEVRTRSNKMNGRIKFVEEELNSMKSKLDQTK